MIDGRAALLHRVALFKRHCLTGAESRRTTPRLPVDKSLFNFTVGFADCSDFSESKYTVLVR